jgi:hypothetical protein
MEDNKMKKYQLLLVVAAGLLTATSCEDYLETSSPSVVDADFVFSNTETARAAMDGAYDTWRDCAQNSVFGDGLYYGVDVTGSDIERHPEAFTNQPGRHYPENLYQNGAFASSYGLLSYQKENEAYARLYNVIGKANAVITAMEGAGNFESIMTAGEPSALSQLYGEAVALRATAYRELTKNFGDVPFQTKFGAPAKGLVPRDSIYDKCLEDLIRVEPLMYPIGQAPGFAAANKNYFSRTYVQGLIGRMALDAGGYQTRRTDLGAGFYKDGKGNALTFEQKGTENNQAVYGRRSDWQTLYTTAKTYFGKVLEQPGSARLHLTDPRSTEKGREYANPYQYFFQQMMMDDAIYADESIYEYPMQAGGGNDARSYSFGRVSSGGGSNAYPCKAYGQGRINPAFYYGIFDPQDKRRDVSVALTGSAGIGREKLIPFSPGSTANGGGPSLNKWDENRQTSPWTKAQRKSGINGPYMRMAEIYLGYAEACAALGDDVTAKQYLKSIRERSFPAGEANTDAFITACGGLLNAVIEERGFEFAGEGDRRWTLVRSGQLPEKIRRIKELTRAMMDGLKTNGYYTFGNGNVISEYVWTKLVDAKTTHGFRLTAQCPAGKEDDPVLYPGWRGQNDDWESFGCNYGGDTKTNLAIKGLFARIDPAGAEAAELVADGYARVDWGKQLSALDDEYYKYLFYDYDYVKAPIYLWPFTPNVLTTGGFTNGYGFKQE